MKDVRGELLGRIDSTLKYQGMKGDIFGIFYKDQLVTLSKVRIYKSKGRARAIVNDALGHVYDDRVKIPKDEVQKIINDLFTEGIIKIEPI